MAVGVSSAAWPVSFPLHPPAAPGGPSAGRPVPRTGLSRAGRGSPADPRAELGEELIGSHMARPLSTAMTILLLRSVRYSLAISMVWRAEVFQSIERRSMPVR